MYCKYCGEKIEKDSKFCSKCGKAVEESKPVSVEEPGKGKAIASLVLGIISLLIGGIFIPVPIVGLVMGCSYKGKCAEKTAGIVLNTIGLILSILSIIFFIIVCTFMINLAVSEIDNFDVDQIGEWEKYSKYVVETDALDYSTNLEGTWKELADERSLFIFNENGEFSYYKNMFNLENDYVSGTYSPIEEMEDLEEFKTNYRFLNKFFNKIIDKISESNIHFLTLKPNRIVEGGAVVPQGDYYEEESIMYLISIHDDIVELTIGEDYDYDEDDEGEVRHFYKVLESN